MEQDVDVLVIGAGVIGICSAYYLLRKGRRVVVVDKGEVCSGCSYGNAGLVVPSYCIPLAAPGVISQGIKWLFDPESPLFIQFRMDRDLLSWLWKFQRHCNKENVRRSIPVIRDLSLKSLQLYEELAAREGLNFGFEQRGMLTVYKRDKTLEKISEDARALGEFGIEVELLNTTQVRELEPNVRFDIAGGVFYPHDAHFRPDRFVRTLASTVSQRGVDIRPSTEVLGMETSGGRITTVRTTRGDFSATEIVLAGGSWSPEIVKDLRLNLPIQPAKGYSITVKSPQKQPVIPLIFAEAKVVVTPMGDVLRFGGTLEFAGMDLSINRHRVEAILRAVPAYLPDMDPGNYPLVEIWRGLRPCTPDGLPLIGRSSLYQNLLIATGHGMLGLSLGPVTGKLVSQLVLNEDPGFNMAQLSVERFR